jgi:hypothetical protein
MKWNSTDTRRSQALSSKGNKVTQRSVIIITQNDTSCIRNISVPSEVGQHYFRFCVKITTLDTNPMSVLV